MRRLFRIVLLFGLMMNVPVYAAGVTLREAVLTALENNNELKARSWIVKRNVSEKKVARGRLFPKLSIEESFSRTSNPTYAFMSKLNQERFGASDFAIDALNDPDTVNNYRTVLSFEMPVFAKKAYVALDIAEETVKASELDFERLRERVARDVFQAFINVVTAKEYLDVAHKALDDAEEHSRIANLRYEAGLGLYSDVLRAEVAVAEADKGIVETEKGLNISKRMLGLLLGADEAIDAADTDFPEIVIADIDAYLETAKERHDLKAMETKYRNAKNAVRFAEADYFPTLGIGGSYELDDHDTPFGSEGKSWQVLAFLKVDLFDGFKRGSERAKAGYQAEEAFEYLDGLRKRITFEVYDAFLSVEEAAKKYELMKTAVRSAEEGGRLVEKRYKNSLAPMVALLDSQVALDKARADKSAMHGRYLGTIAELEYASGRILDILGVGDRGCGESVCFTARRVAH